MEKRCNSCKFWSDLIAKSEAGTTVAMCLCDESPGKGKYTTKWGSCDKQESGPPVDQC